MLLLEKLSPCQKQVIELVMKGKTNKEIARIRGVSPKTVDTQRHRAMEKMGVHNLAELINAVRDEQEAGWLGWKCPACSTINAPWTPFCGNASQHGVLRAVV